MRRENAGDWHCSYSRLLEALPHLFNQPEGEKIPSGRNGDVLLAIKDVRHRRGVERRICLKFPERLAGSRIDGSEHPSVAAYERDAVAKLSVPRHELAAPVSGISHATLPVRMSIALRISRGMSPGTRR
jgi:hypothetical protein